MSDQASPAADPRFASVGRARRVWAVGSINGHAAALAELHRRIGERFQAGDRLVYLGNVVGRGPGSAAALDDVLLMRSRALSHHAAAPGDVVFLRGGLEEMTDKFLNLHMATDPLPVFEWMCLQGLDSILSAYGLSITEARRCCERGPKEIAQFAVRTRDALAARPGHRDYFFSLRRAAFDEHRKLLFVSAGLDPSRPLDTQGDELWWGGEGFDSISAPFGTFQRIVRGMDPKRRGFAQGQHFLTLDHGDRELVLHAALLDSEGAVLDTVSAPAPGGAEQEAAS